MTQTPSHYDGPALDPEPMIDAGDDHRFAAVSQSSTPESGDTFGDPATSGSDTSVHGTAKDEAGKVAETGAQAAKDVASTAKDEAANVVAETKQQAKTLFESTLGELQSQGGAQQQRLASSLHSLAQELGGMASGSEQSGPLTDLAKKAAHKGGEVAHWLETHEPADVLREVQTFARRRPVAFLALCGLAGVVAGRIARGATAANTTLDSSSTGYDVHRQLGGATATNGASTYSGGDQFGTRYEEPVPEAYESRLGTAGTGVPSLGAASTRPGGV